MRPFLLLITLASCRAAPEQNQSGKNSEAQLVPSTSNHPKKNSAGSTDPHDIQIFLVREENKIPSADLRISTDKRYLYWSEVNHSGGWVYMANKDGSDIKKIGVYQRSRSPSGLLPSGDILYLLDWGKIRRYSIRSAKEIDPIELPANDWGGGLTFSDSKIYVVQTSGTYFIEIDKTTLKQVKYVLDGITTKTGSTTYALAHEGALYISSGAARQLIRYDLGTKSYKILTDASVTEPLFPKPSVSDRNHYGELLIHEGFIYWGISRNATFSRKYAQALFRIPLGGGTVEKLALHPNALGGSIQLKLDVPNQLLYSLSTGSYGDSVLYRYNLRTKKSTLLAKDLESYFSFAFDGTHLYWGGDVHHIWKMLPPPPGVPFTPKKSPSNSAMD